MSNLWEAGFSQICSCIIFLHYWFKALAKTSISGGYCKT